MAPPSEKGGSYGMCGGDWLRGQTKERELREDAKIRVCMRKVSGCCCIMHDSTFVWRKFCYLELANSPTIFLFSVIYKADTYGYYSIV